MSFLFVGFPFLRFFFFFLHPTASIETQADTHSVYKCKTNEGSKEESGGIERGGREERDQRTRSRAWCKGRLMRWWKRTRRRRRTTKETSEGWTRNERVPSRGRCTCMARRTCIISTIIASFLLISVRSPLTFHLIIFHRSPPANFSLITFLPYPPPSSTDTNR